MPAITKEKALEILTDAIQHRFEADELLEIHDSIFSKRSYPAKDAHEDKSPLIEKLVNYIHRGLEIELIMDMWGLVFPLDRNVFYDEIGELIEYTEGSEVVSAK